MAKENKKGGQKDGMDEYAGHLEKKEKAKNKPEKKFDLVGSIMAHEAGELDDEGEKELFTHLRKTGMVNKLQGHYGRLDNHYKKTGFLP
jgi:hypothetical protein